jgi:biopolymer transport protein ExbB
MEQVNFDLFTLIVAGGLATFPLLVGSVLAIAIAVDRGLAFRGTERQIARLDRRLVQAIASGTNVDAAVAEAERAGGAGGLVLAAVARVVQRGGAAEDLARILEARVFEALEGLRQRLWLLATVGTIAPFVGLFGTVVGIMRSFHAIAASGSGGFAVVAAGISEALVATALGLGVAVVAVAFYNYFEARLERIEGALRIAAGHVAEAAPSALAA